MDNNVQFEGENNFQRNNQNQGEDSAFVKLAMKMGAKDRNQAQMYLLVGAIVILAIAAFIYFR